jgi:lipopolysaccharide transport system ATP-binding protein
MHGKEFRGSDLMSDVAIRVENLSKRYLVGRRAGRRERYTALRDVIGRKAQSFARQTADLIRGRQIVEGDQVEEFWALRDVSFELKQGEVLGVIGRNGAGKSTLLKILSRITEPSEGRAVLQGRIASLLEVGTGFHPELSGRENIFLNGAILGMRRSEIRRKFDEIVAFADVDRFIDTPLKRYSSGMYVRLAFAVAAHLDSEILAIDEVLAVGDAAFQKKCIGKMGAMVQDGRTILFVSHNMNAIERLCRSVICLERGRLFGAYDDVREGVMAYLGRDGQNAGSNVWINERQECDNEYFVPHRLEVSSTQPVRAGEPLSNSFPIEIVVAGVVRRTDPALNVGVVVYDENDELLFFSFTTDQTEERWPRLTPGPVCLRALVPPRLLNEGTYRVEFLVSLHCRAWLLEPRRNAPAVVFTIQGGLSDSSYWDFKRPGVLAPVLSWEVVEPAKSGPASRALEFASIHSAA